MSSGKWTGTVDWLVRELPGQPVGIMVDRLAPRSSPRPSAVRTRGHLFTRDHTLAAQIVVAWFQDNSDAPPHGEMGCAYELADVLPAEAYEDDPASGDSPPPIRRGGR